ncbi:MAG: ATP-binding protein [Candidatus Gracilibacteria bacterium]
MIKREILNEIKYWLNKEKIIILKGARQVGKTTLMKKIESYINKDKKNVTVFLQADKIDNNDIFKTPDTLITYLNAKYDFPNTYVYLFIDEFQYIKQAGLFLKNIFDEYKDNLQIIVSGSSSLEITKNSEFLTGRAITFYIDRISFIDFFNYKENIKNTKKIDLDNFTEIEKFYSVFKNLLEKNFLDFITYGAYPEVVSVNNIYEKETIINQIIETYIQKDIIDFLNIENIKAFNDLIKILSSNIGNLVNINEIASTINISIQTVNKYIDILEGTFVFSRVRPFFKNTRKELSKMPKIFIEDISIKNYFLREFDSISNKIDLGMEVENFVYTELRKVYKKDQIFFYRTVSKAEIDFIIEDKFESYIEIEVKYRNKVGLPKVMKNFEENYSVIKKIIITKDILKNEDDVYYIPACLLSLINIRS